MDDVFEHERFTRYFTAEEMADFRDMTTSERLHLSMKMTEEYFKYLSSGSHDEVGRRPARFEKDKEEGGPRMSDAIIQVQYKRRNRTFGETLSRNDA